MRRIQSPKVAEDMGDDPMWYLQTKNTPAYLVWMQANYPHVFANYDHFNQIYWGYHGRLIELNGKLSLGFHGE